MKVTALFSGTPTRDSARHEQDSNEHQRAGTEIQEESEKEGVAADAIKSMRNSILS